MIKMIKVTTTLSENVVKTLTEKAGKLGFLRVPAYIRYLIVRCLEKEEPDDGTVTVENYDEMAAYARAKGLGSVGVFANFAMKQYISRNRLTDAQKARIEKSID